MNYLITQLSICLLGALFLGGLIGWLLYRWLKAGAWGEAEGRLRAEIDKFRGEAVELRSSLTADRGKLQKAEGSLTDHQLKLTAALADVGTHRAELVGMRGELAAKSASLDGLAADLNGWKTKFADLEPLVARKESDFQTAMRRMAAAEKDCAAKDVELKNSLVEAISL